MTIAKTLDSTAIGLSGLCLAHCLLLPVGAAFLPLFASLADMEWVHRVFVLLAIPVSGLAIASALGTRGGRLFAVIAVLGLLLLFVAAFVEALHDVETPLTVAGGLLLAGAHGWRWFQRVHAH
ncbi:MerC domain-containing protein [Parasphingopyxis sp.]|uniref:MerC domain-containing protein n=1 Tax=Parasphingopyxis sp. TaxID=1920299 RepID=UPI0026355DC7|nr:MerC domain-containing protein [Parasphingopyxis sp.]